MHFSPPLLFYYILARDLAMGRSMSLKTIYFGHNRLLLEHNVNVTLNTSAFNLLSVCFVFIQERIKTARSRVVIASLYLGTGPLEQDLVCFHQVLYRSGEACMSCRSIVNE